jgi:hypothetical protein
MSNHIVDSTLLRQSDFKSSEEVRELFSHSVVIGELWSHCGKCSHTVNADQNHCDNCRAPFNAKLIHPKATQGATRNMFPNSLFVGIGTGSADAETCAVL